MEEHDTEVQSLVLSCPRQDIIVEVPVINGEPPVTLVTHSRDSEASDVSTDKTCDLTIQPVIQLYGGSETTLTKQNNIRMKLSKEEQLQRRREQNRCRMRALRASESEVAQRLREQNKFRMRRLRASQSHVAQSLKERNKCRMREIRSLDSQLIGKDTEHNPFSRNIMVAEGELSNNSWKSSVDMGVIYAKDSKFICDCVDNSNTQEKQKADDSECKPKTVTSQCKLCTAEYVGDSVSDCQVHSRNHILKEEVRNFEAESPRACKFLKVKNEDTSDTSEVLSPHFINYNVQIPQNVDDMSKVEIEDNLGTKERYSPEMKFQSELRRERGRLRMRLKRHAETKEEAERRREKGRLRMRVLRASETEEQASRRRELNRLRMRMKRNSIKSDESVNRTHEHSLTYQVVSSS